MMKEGKKRMWRRKGKAEHPRKSLQKSAPISSAKRSAGTKALGTGTMNTKYRAPWGKCD